MKACNQCGKCCINYSDGGLSATANEVEYWEVFRPAISRYVSEGQIWMEPTSGEQMKQCPWLRKVPGQAKYSCDIYYDRPDDCKHYPVTIDQMVRDECEMLEARYLAKPKLAQTALDRLMANSRPPLKQER